MTFGLGNAGQTFQHDLLTRWREDSTLCIPTVMIFLSSRKTTHSMRSTFTNFSLAWRNMAYLLTPLSALSFWASEVIIITSFLGYQISPSGTKPLESKDEAIKEFPVPKTVRQLRRFLGMLNFYRRFLPHSAAIQVTLNALLACRVKASQSVDISGEALLFFNKCKESWAIAALLAHPDSQAELALVTDASSSSNSKMIFGNPCVLLAEAEPLPTKILTLWP